MRDYLKLHLVVILWGFTAVLGNLIEMTSTQVVVIRSAVSAAILFAVLPSRAKISPRLAGALTLNGMLLGFHWVMFFLAVKIANVSICMIGMATISFWTALLEPLLIRKVRFQWINLILGGIVILAVYGIFQSETRFHLGLIVALVGALLATLFSIINGLFAGSVDEQSVVMYEMAGSAIFCLSTLAVAQSFGWELVGDHWWPQGWEWLWFALLIFGGTLLAYQMYIQLLRKLSVFTINFANNLEPVYGICLGALFFKDHQSLGPGYYVGAAVIFGVVIAQPWLSRWFGGESRSG